jgi:hypothetical protein
MQGDGSRLIEDEVSVLQYGYQPVWIQLQERFLLVGARVTIDEYQSMLNPDLMEQDMREKTDVARVVIEFEHGATSIAHARRHSPLRVSSLRLTKTAW